MDAMAAWAKPRGSAYCANMTWPPTPPASPRSCGGGYFQDILLRGSSMPNRAGTAAALIMQK